MTGTLLALLGLSGVFSLGLIVLLRRERRSGESDAPEAWARRVRELRSSRLEIVNAYEIERRRVERDLHDGAQQHLVVSSFRIGEALLLLSADDTSETSRRVVDLLTGAQDATDSALAAVRETVSGIHPTVLSDLGLESAVREMAARSRLDAVVRVPHPLPTIPEGVAATAYFLVSEAIVNVSKHAPEARASILLSVDDDLHVSVVDDGPGGAHIRTGHGLAGMTERLAAFGGTLQLSSPAGGPTTLNARVPLLLPTGTPEVSPEPPARCGTPT
ncbi:sensor histidine kinase [Dietzia sp. PP-33]|jgi:signal transduction histidine kinase|uniref:sensor histidine kinase n=1 Tax=Dietzia sp. PP-33 TaxID=2957500 RepID=UPI0029A083C5|nr:histidine kinase [Dietzia sp. PP-33]MDX2356579.1 histidine kinase [Dietzia sp. PP-33]